MSVARLNRPLQSYAAKLYPCWESHLAILPKESVRRNTYMSAVDAVTRKGITTTRSHSGGKLHGDIQKREKDSEHWHRVDGVNCSGMTYFEIETGTQHCSGGGERDL